MNLKELSLDELIALIHSEGAKLNGFVKEKRPIELGETLALIGDAVRKAKWRLLDLR